jgi:hypothetical protein
MSIEIIVRLSFRWTTILVRLIRLSFLVHFSQTLRLSSKKLRFTIYEGILFNYIAFALISGEECRFVVQIQLIDCTFFVSLY